MIDRLSVLCFAGTYGLAMASDLSRFFIRTTKRWYVTIALLVLGWLVHTAYLVNLLWNRDLGRIATQFSFVVILSWIFAVIALYLIAREPRTVAISLFLLPLVVALSTLAGVMGRRDQWTDWADWTPYWANVHGVFLSLGAVLSCVAFVAGLMYLAQVARLRSKSGLAGSVKLPSLEQAERLNRLAVTLAFPFLTFGFLIGVVLNWTGDPATGAFVLRWNDPKILSAGITWLVFAGLVHARFRPEMRGRRVMVLSIVAFAFLVFTMFGVNWLLQTAHGVPPVVGALP